jgi:hypothetical protein
MSGLARRAHKRMGLAGPRLAIVAASAVALSAAACAPGAPKGVDKAELDRAVSEAIGDPATCLMMADRESGRIVYRYNTATVCSRQLPACEGQEQRTLKDLLLQTARDGQPRQQSCLTTPDGSRGVSWAAGVIPSRNLAWAAVMEGTRTFPGRMMTERLEPRLRALGL